MKKIIIVNASPRKGGNCDVVADKLSSELKDAEVEVFALRDKKVGPCLACNACKSRKTVCCNIELPRIAKQKSPVLQG